MGAIAPWHVVVLGLCCLFSLAAVTGVVMLIVKLAQRDRPPRG